MPTTWGGVFQNAAVILLIVWGVALLVPALAYLIPRAASRASQANDRDKKIINGTAILPAVCARNGEGE